MQHQEIVDIDFSLTVAGALVGLLVGITGMGGGALLTPLLVLVFGVPPLAAISSDLVTSLVMKPIGGAVHFRRGTVNVPLVLWLAGGAVPAAFAGAVLIGSLGNSHGVQSALKITLGGALVASFAAGVAKGLIDRRGDRRRHAGEPLVIVPGRTLLIGVIGGFAVGMTSVGAGSLVIAMLLLAYPQLRPGQLVGTDIVQAVPLVASAALGHLLFGAVHLSVTTSLLLGAIPAVFVGAHVSSRAPSWLIRPIISAVLLSSALALLKAPAQTLIPAALVGAGVTWWIARPRRSATPTTERALAPAANR